MCARVRVCVSIYVFEPGVIGPTGAVVGGRPDGGDGGGAGGGVRPLSVPLYGRGGAHKVVLGVAILEKRRKEGRRMGQSKDI